MAPVHRLETLLEQHVDRLAQAEQEMLGRRAAVLLIVQRPIALGPVPVGGAQAGQLVRLDGPRARRHQAEAGRRHQALLRAGDGHIDAPGRSEEHTSELQSLMRISYAVFCLKKKKINYNNLTLKADTCGTMPCNIVTKEDPSNTKFVPLLAKLDMDHDPKYYNCIYTDQSSADHTTLHSTSRLKHYTSP